MIDIINRIINKIKQTQIFKSIFRSSFPDTEKGKAEIVFTDVWLHIHPVKVLKEGIKITHTFCLGGISFALFLILTVTGLLLMFYYHPSVPQAYYDMKDLEFSVSFGVFLRNLHRWSAHAMVAFVFLHMCRIFYTGSYKPPREFNWVIGILLLVITLGLSFTGYLLPWDQLAFWAITVGTSIASYAPILGKTVQYILLGGNIIGENALLRFYVLHCVFLPAILIIFMIVHFWRIRKDGGISKPL